MRRWRKAHPGEHAADTRAFYAQHRDELAMYFADYRRTHRHIRQAIDARRRGKKVAATGSYTAAQWLALQIVWQGRCAYCRCPAPVQADHRIPLARGGMNGIDNILSACATCNQRKHLLTEDEFRARLARERGDAA